MMSTRSWAKTDTAPAHRCLDASIVIPRAPDAAPGFIYLAAGESITPSHGSLAFANALSVRVKKKPLRWKNRPKWDIIIIESYFFGNAPKAWGLAVEHLAATGVRIGQ